jgi:hypothetical protein
MTNKNHEKSNELAEYCSAKNKPHAHELRRRRQSSMSSRKSEDGQTVSHLALTGFWPPWVFHRRIERGLAGVGGIQGRIFGTS